MALLGPQEPMLRVLYDMDDMVGGGVCEGDDLFKLAMARLTIHIEPLVHRGMSKASGAMWGMDGVQEDLSGSGVQGLEKEKRLIINGGERVHKGDFFLLRTKL